jgi:hypothetical protein
MPSMIALILRKLDDTNEVSIQALDNNRAAPIELWEEVYFKEGLHAALADRARRKGELNVTQQLSKLYAQLKLHKNDPQLIDRRILKSDLDETLASLKKLV